MKQRILRILSIIILIFLIFLIKPQNGYCALYGTEVSDYSTLKHFLELNDGNEYHIYLKNDIGVSETIHVNGKKTLATSSSLSSACTIYNTINATNADANNQSLNVTSGANLTIDRLIFNGGGKLTNASTNMTVWGTCTVQNYCEFWWGRSRSSCCWRWYFILEQFVFIQSRQC